MICGTYRDDAVLVHDSLCQDVLALSGVGSRANVLHLLEAPFGIGQLRRRFGPSRVVQLKSVEGPRATISLSKLARIHF